MAYNCDLCHQPKANLSHKNCKYEYLDLIKISFKKEITDFENIIKKKNNEIENLQDRIDKLVSENMHMIKEKLEYTNRISELESQLRSNLSPDKKETKNKISTLNMSLNEGMCLFQNSPKSNSFSCDNSPEDDKFPNLIVPKRKASPLKYYDRNFTTWNSKDQLKNLKNVSRVDDLKLNVEKNFNKSKEKIDLDKSKNFKQTKLTFNSIPQRMESHNNTLENTEMEDETFCELIPATPPNKNRSRSSTKSNTFEEQSKKPLIEKQNCNIDCDNNSDVDSDDIICITDNTPTLNFSDCDSNSKDLMEDDFLGKENTKNANHVSYREKVSPIRKKSDKMKQPGFQCTDCANFYKIIGMSMNESQLQQKLQKCSKHRKNQFLHHTPEGFWDPRLTPTQKD